jgi:hypothetical protein
MTSSPARPSPTPPARPTPRLATLVESFLILGLCILHGGAIWQGMEGRKGLDNPWPLARHDHPIYFHSAWITPSFLRRTGTTAGYDPYFMAGYAKSVVFPASSTLPDLVGATAGRGNLVRAYKLYVLIAAALPPWLVAGAGLAWGLQPRAIAAAILLWLVYVWTDFPIHYVNFGMLPYFLAVPLGLLATAAVTGYLLQGGFRRWLAASLGSSLVVLVHFTTGMVVVPASLAAYVMASGAARRGRRPFPASRHVGVWLVPSVVLGLNAFWWWPGVWLASTKGPSDFAFVHPEPVWRRLAQIATTEATAESLLIGLGGMGLAVMLRRDRVAAAALGGFAAAGFAWGYLAGASRTLDFLQPGRHTFAFYSAAALAAGVALVEVLGRLRAGGRWLPVAAILGMALLGVRAIGPELAASYGFLLGGPEPFLSSRPSPQLIWAVDRIKRHVPPGSRLLYEEGGIDNPAIRYPGPDPFRGGRYSGLLPFLTGVECLGGPYLRAALTTNFTQFGGGALFGMPDWDRAHFERYARLYRPEAIVCWSRWARVFCRGNPDLIEVLDDNGVLLIGRVKGFGGAAIRGRADVQAEPGRLVVSALSADLDGLVVLRYHSVPRLRSRPAVRLESVNLQGDPVPFLGLRPSPGAPGPLTLELDVPLRRPW